MKPGVRRSLGEKFPTLDDIITLYAVWVSDPPRSSSREATYITRTPEKNAGKALLNDVLSDDDDNDSVRTLPRRIKSISSTRKSPRFENQEDSAKESRKRSTVSDQADDSHPSKRRAVNVEMTLEDPQEFSDSGWTSDEISFWVDGCSNSNSIPEID